MKHMFQTVNNQLRIVVAEDDKISRVMLNAILRKWGYDVVPAKDGMECLEMLCSSPVPTVGFFDWYMPDFDGRHICQSIRRIETEQPVHLILMTAHNDGTEALRSLEAGADDFLAKPYSITDLNAQMIKAERHLGLLQRLWSLGGGSEVFNPPSSAG